MESSVKELSKYRLERSREDLETAEENLASGKYRASVNRAYYAVFHALRAITALDRFDSGKHSGIRGIHRRCGLSHIQWEPTR